VAYKQNYRPNDNDFREKYPAVDVRVRKTKSGRGIVLQTIITDIRPVTYFQKMLEGDSAADQNDEEGQITEEKAK